MMRPATPLSVLFLVAFAFLLLSTLSTPVIKAIPIASFNGTDFGVLGFCTGDKCSPLQVGYDAQSLISTESSFTVAESTRHSLSSILIIHPIAALLALICFALTVASHFHAPGHSPRFLLGLFILTIPTFLASLLAFLVDILLFIPHVSWGGWIVLASTIILLISSLITCGMRRSLVGRKARRKRIQENAEMNGEAQFNAVTAKHEAAFAGASLARAESPPPLSGTSATAINDKSSFSFPAYDNKLSSQDDRVPLNANTAPLAMSGGAGSAYGDPMRPRDGSQSRGVDQYGNALPPGMVPPMRRPSMESNGSDPAFYGRGGRGGYPPGRGGYPPRGGPMMRGGPQNVRGPPPPGWRGRGGPGGAMMGRGGPASNYGSQDRYSPSPYGQGPRGMSPDGQGLHEPSIGQAIEMDANIGVPSPVQSPVQPNASEGGFIPARAQWNAAPPPNNGNRNLSPIQASPIDSSSKYSSRQTRTGSGSYYEDVDPRFAETGPPITAAGLPNALAVGPPAPQRTAHVPTSNPDYNPNNLHPMGSHPDVRDLRQESQESLQEGQRSPATSDASHFTSVSQRGINPNWRPPPGSMGPGMGPGRGPPPNRNNNDILLNANPDFSLPGMGPAGRGRGGFRGRGGSGMGRQSPAMGMGGGGLGQPSRYPMP